MFGWWEAAGAPKVEVPPHINPLGKRVQQVYDEDQFGLVQRNNRDRYLAIVQAIAAQGAREGDVEKAMSHGIVSWYGEPQGGGLR